ncbi:CLUMA_CG020394, isoform A [Clunio marinus]|uniref:Transporter n=1 Tax=Clunio marinus TaxID=568069 RepID=A0A1J1J4T4_9DIPT|nr:CLUMA_CG020394, isoform A [Clunio marinus]
MSLNIEIQYDVKPFNGVNKVFNEAQEILITKKDVTNGTPKFNEEHEKSQSASKEKWGKDIEFLLSCIALSVGLGNVWRFPFTALENGGGAFILPYIIVLIFVGKPLYYMELVLGQFSSRGCIKVYDMSPAMRGIGVGQVISTCFVTTYYASLMALTIHYFLVSFKDPLPWSMCKEEWNVSCIDSSSIISNISSMKIKSSTELYFIKDVLREENITGGGIGVPNWQLCACLIVTWTIISCILIKGIKSSGKASYILASFPYFVMIILLIRALTLEGAMDGIKYLFTPQWDKILEANVWYAAITQVFYSLAVCFGSIIMYSSYNRFNQNIYRDVNTITILDTCTSLLAGLIIFGILGHLAFVMKVDISEVTKSNIALAFMAYPETISKIDLFPQFFSAVFFVMLFILGMGSNIGMCGCIITVVRDKFPQIPCWKVVLTIAGIGIAIGSLYTTPYGQYLINFLDFYGASFVALILSIVELLTVSWIYGVDRFCGDIEFMLKRKTGLYWRICWAFITPFMMIGIFLYFIATWRTLTYQGIEYSSKMHKFGWFISFFCLSHLIIIIFYEIFKEKCKLSIHSIVNAFKPSSSWGPLEPGKLQEYKEFVMLRKADIKKQRSLFKKIKQNVFGK